MYVKRVRQVLGAPSRGALAAIVIVTLAQVSLLGIYLASFDIAPVPFHLYPIIWITVGCWVVWHARPVASSTRRTLLAAGLAVLYFFLLAWLGGLISPGAETTAFTGMRIDGAAPPGYAPAIYYVHPIVTMAVIPYRLVGYVALAYLVYVTVLDAWAASAPGLLGVFGCIGCSWPLLAALVSGASGTGGALATAVYANAYPISTIAFLLAVGLLYWRPSVDSLRQWRQFFS